MWLSRDNRSDVAPEKGSGSGSSAANVDLRKLRRLDLLELLVDQIRENEQDEKTIEELTDFTERLKAKLDDKDAQIEHLKEKLDDKDVQIEHLKSRLNSKDVKIATLEEHLGIAQNSFVVFSPEITLVGEDASAAFGEHDAVDLPVAEPLDAGEPDGEPLDVSEPVAEPLDASESTANGLLDVDEPAANPSSASDESADEASSTGDKPLDKASSTKEKPEKKGKSSGRKGLLASLPFFSKGTRKPRKGADKPKLDKSSLPAIEAPAASSMPVPSPAPAASSPTSSVKSGLSSLPDIDGSKAKSLSESELPAISASSSLEDQVTRPLAADVMETRPLSAIEAPETSPLPAVEKPKIDSLPTIKKPEIDDSSIPMV